MPKNNLFRVMLQPVLKCPYFLGMLITVACYQLSIRISTEIRKSFATRHPGSFSSVFLIARLIDIGALNVNDELSYI